MQELYLTRKISCIPIIILLLFHTTVTNGQSNIRDSLPYELDQEEWTAANKLWQKKNLAVTLVTRDSIVRNGQILCLNDTALLFYSSAGIFNVNNYDSLTTYIPAEDIEAVYVIRERRRLPANLVGTATGAAIGTGIGTALHYLVPNRKFHPVFIATSGGAGAITGYGLADSRVGGKYLDTLVLCDAEELSGTLANDSASVLRMSLYDYTLWRVQLPDSALWTDSTLHFTGDTIDFDQIAAASPGLQRAFPLAGLYVSLIGKVTVSRYHDLFEERNVFHLLNLGYRINTDWSVDFYYSNYTAKINRRSPFGNYPSIHGQHMGIAASYAFVWYDRLSRSPVQLNGGMGFAYSCLQYDQGAPGNSDFETFTFGLLLTTDGSVYMTKRLAVVFAVQCAILRTRWYPGQTVFTNHGHDIVPPFGLDPSYLQFGFGLRYMI